MDKPSNSPDSELKRFRQRLAVLDAQRWDTQIESDTGSGKLDTLAAAAIDDYERGDTQAL